MPKWNRYGWCSLVDVQQALAARRYEDALRSAALVEGHALSLPERMWLKIYSGFALDSLGRRNDALVAYRAAAVIHPHSLATRGVEAPLRDIKHVRGLSEKVPKGWRLHASLFKTDNATLEWCALIPNATEPRHPMLIRVGHPSDEGFASSRILELTEIDGVPEDIVIAHTNVIATVRGARRLYVDDAELVAEVPRRFHAVVRAITQELPVDPARVYLTGFSFDGVWSVILGLSRPELYAGVIALSAVTYPAPITVSIAAGNARRIPICILRGDGDHMFPHRLEQERRLGTEIMRAHPDSLWQVLPNTTHAGVWEHAGLCYRRILARR